MPRNVSRAARAAVLAVGAFGALTPAASAAPRPALVTNCPSLGAITQSFSKFGDLNDYQLMPSSSFESGATGWTLTGGAAVISGNESFKVRSSSDFRSLKVPGGGTATSPPFCVGTEHPTFRGFVMSPTARSNDVLLISLLWKTDTGTPMTYALVAMAGGYAGTWKASPAFAAGSALPLQPGEHTMVQVRVSVSAGAWQFDDLYLDPARGR